MKLTSETNKVLSYWLRSIEDSQLLSISAKEIESLGSQLSFPDLLKGLCPEEIFIKLSETAEKLDRNKNFTKEKDPDSRFPNDQASDLEVLICPIRLVKDRNYPFGPRSIEPFWLPASLSGEGKLKPRGRLLPWIPRAHLEPLNSDETLTFAELETFSKALEIFEDSNTENWKDYWKACNRLFKATVKKDFVNFSLENYSLKKNAVIVLDNCSQGAAIHVERLYADVLSGRRPPGSLETIAKLSPTERRYGRSTARSYAGSSKQHLGQISNAFSLSTTQRRALHNFFDLEDFEVLSVTGPPGTGKTTFIQSLVATLWVQAALKEDLPPLILACAGTNQAVTNIISSFSKAGSKSGALAGRWLPQVSGFGSYCPSESQVLKYSAPEYSDFNIERTTGEGFSKSIENWNYLSLAKNHFLECFEKCFDKSYRLDKAIKFLNKQLQREVHLLHRELGRATNSKILQIILRQKSLSKKELITLVRKLDRGPRHRLFQLASHYWEGRWIIAAEEELSLSESRSKQPRFKSLAEDWHRRAMLTPCFVATATMAPRFFGRLSRDYTQLLDLLIVDEAGQLSPEIGAAPFALTKKAVVVGDTLQLQPIWSVPEYLESENLFIEEIIKKKTDTKHIKALEKKGLLASSGDLMSLAISACPIADDQTYGAFLSEHRRSVPKLVAYCNQLAYRGRLKPKRPPLENPLFSPFCYAHIPGKAQRIGSSWQNKIEAEAIFSWVCKNQDRLEQHYPGKSLSDLVAIITPFAAQKFYLYDLFRKKFPNLTIGTVHSLQGAEREFVIFSSVYSQKQKINYFFDRNVNMLNVAVSRAKDSFAVFGDMGIFKTDSKTPAGLLAQFLFEEDSNQLSGVELPLRKEFKKNNLERLTSLEEHRELLQNAFQIARKEIVVVSPTISSLAIIADKIPELIKNAKARGVKVLVYTDYYLGMDQKSGILKPNCKEGRELLTSAGAQLKVLMGIHNKSLSIDDKVVVEGSFNWFSALRNIDSPYQKIEFSICYQGSGAKKVIRETKEILASVEQVG